MDRLREELRENLDIIFVIISDFMTMNYFRYPITVTKSLRAQVSKNVSKWKDI